MKVRDNGRVITVPPAAYVSNLFMDKYATALPWSYVAGSRRGVVSGRGVLGVETNLSKEDRDYHFKFFHFLLSIREKKQTGM